MTSAIAVLIDRKIHLKNKLMINTDLPQLQGDELEEVQLDLLREILEIDLAIARLCAPPLKLWNPN